MNEDDGGTSLDDFLGLAPVAPPRDDPNRSLLRDAGNSLAAGAAGFGASLAGAAEYVVGSGGVATRAREGLQDFAAERVQAMSPQMQRARSREWLPGGTNPDGSRTENVWEDGGGWGALAAQALEALPSLFATVVPGGLLARGMSAAGATIAATRAGVGAVAGGVTGASLAGEVFNSVVDELQNRDDSARREVSPFYRDLREQGMGEGEALDRTIREAAGYKPLLAGALGAVAGHFLEGRAIADVATGRAGGVVSSALRGARGEGMQEGVEGVVGTDLSQRGQEDASGRPYSLRDTAQAGVQGVVLGAAMGGGVGALGGMVAPVDPALVQANAPAPAATPPAATQAPPASPPPVDPALIQAGSSAAPTPPPEAPAPVQAPVAPPVAPVAPPVAPVEAPAPVQAPVEPPTGSPAMETIQNVQATGIDLAADPTPDPNAIPVPPGGGTVAPAQEPALTPGEQGATPIAPPTPAAPVAPPRAERDSDIIETPTGQKITRGALKAAEAAGVDVTALTGASKTGAITTTQVRKLIAEQKKAAEPAPKEAPAPIAAEPTKIPERVVEIGRAPPPKTPAAPKPPAQRGFVEGIVQSEKPGLVSSARSTLEDNAVLGEDGQTPEEIVESILRDIVAEVKPGRPRGEIVGLFQSRVDAAIKAEVAKREAARDAAENADPETESDSEESWGRASSKRIDAAMRGSGSAIRALVGRVSGLSQDKLGDFYRRFVVPAVERYTAAGRRVPEWALSFRDFMEAADGRGGSAESKAAHNARVQEWRGKFENQRSIAAENVAATSAEVEKVFDEAPQITKLIADGKGANSAKLHYKRIASRIADIIGSANLQDQLEMLGSTTSPAAVIARIASAGSKVSEEQGLSRVAAAELQMRSGNAAQALTELRSETDTRAKSGSGEEAEAATEGLLDNAPNPEEAVAQRQESEQAAEEDAIDPALGKREREAAPKVRVIQASNNAPKTNGGPGTAGYMPTIEERMASLKKLKPNASDAELRAMATSADNAAKARAAKAEASALDMAKASLAARQALAAQGTTAIAGFPESVATTDAQTMALLEKAPIAEVYASDGFINDSILGSESGSARLGPAPRGSRGRLLQALDITTAFSNDLIADVWKLLRGKVGNTPILVFSDADWNAAYGINGNPADVAGIFVPSSLATVQAGGQPGVILMPQSLFTNMEGKFNGVANFQTVVMHEMAHAASVMTVFQDTKARAKLEKLIKHVQAHLKATRTKASTELKYALTSPEEFIAVAMTDEGVQAELMAVPVSKEDRARMGLLGKITNAFQGFVAWVRSALGADVFMDNALSAVVEIAGGTQDGSGIGEPGVFQNANERVDAFNELSAPSESDIQPLMRMPEAVSNFFSPEGKSADIMQALRNVGLGFSTLRQIAQDVSGLFKRDARMQMLDPASQMAPEDQLVEAVTRRSEIAQEYIARLFIKPLQALRNLRTKQRDEVNELLGDATRFEAHADNPSADSGSNAHLKGTARKKVQSRAMHAKLHARYNAMTAEQQDAYRGIVKAMAQAHADMSNLLAQDLTDRWYASQIDAHLKDPTGHPMPVQRNALPGLAARLLKGPPPKSLLAKLTKAGTPVPAEYLTQQDIDMLSDQVLQSADTIRKRARMEGPYSPQMRFGDYVVRWMEDGPPGGVHSFASKADADNFAENSELPVIGEREVYYDASGNEITQPDPAELQKEMAVEKANLTPNSTALDIITAERKATRKAWATTKANAPVTKYEVTVQQQGVAYFDKASEANRAVRILREAGKKEVRDTDRRRDQMDRGSLLADADIERMVAAIDADKSLSPEYRDKAKQTLRDVSVLVTPNRAVNATLIQRRKVLGASADVSRSVANYALATGNYQAGIKTSVPITDSLRAMREQARMEQSNLYGDNKDTLRRRNALIELERRVLSDSGDPSGRGSTNPILRKVQALSYIYYLASPSYSMIQMTQPWLLSMPILGARYGTFRSGKALSTAMKDIGMRSILGNGVQDTLNALRTLTTGKESDPTPYLAQMQARLASKSDGAELNAMLKRLADEGLVDSMAGMELIRSELTEETWASTKLGQTEALARAMPAAIEVINRASTAVATYRLARSKGADIHTATMEARKVVDQSQGDYGSANTARHMDPRRHPWLAPMMTFRKYAQAMYSLLIRQAYLSVKGKSPQERKEAFRVLAGVLTAHMLVAGALGLPTEVFGVLIGAASLLFGADEPWDWEQEVRQALSDAFGPEVGEVLARGLPRAAGLDLSSRLGLNGLIFMKDLRDFESRTMSGYAGELVMGAPGGMVLTALSSVGQVMDGDYGRALEGVLPKGFRDTLKAMRIADEGITTKRGERIDGGRTLDASEMVMQALGFTPASIAEVYERRNAVQGAARRLNTERVDLMRRWRQADPEDRPAIWERIQAWNQRIPPEGREARITRANLIASMNEARRRLRESGSEDYLPRGREYLRREGEFANTRTDR